MRGSIRHRSFFWPILLIGAGIIWLLVNLNVIEAVSLNSLLRLWPLILVVIGLDLLFGHQSSWGGAVIGVLTVAAVVGFLIFGPSLGWTTGAESDAKVESFSVPLEKTSSADIILHLAGQPVSIYPLSNKVNLMEAEIGHTGILEHSVTGTDVKTIRLSQSMQPGGWLSFDLSGWNLSWKVGITSEIPVNLTLEGGSGSVKTDLSGIKLGNLNASMGSGSSKFILPKSSKPYAAKVESGSGEIAITLPAQTNLTLEMDSSSGSVRIDLPANAFVRVEVTDSGTGSLNLPGNLVSSTSSSGNGMGSWQTEGYEKAAYKILIRFTHRGSGSIDIH